MFAPSDERFEAYLKQFHPLAPEPMPRSENRRSSFRSAVLVWAALAAAAVSAAVVASRYRSSLDTNENSVDARPLTIRAADDLLGRAPSIKAAIDGMAAQQVAVPISKNRRSALAALSQEENTQ